MAKIFDIHADLKCLHRYQKGHKTQRKPNHTALQEVDRQVEVSSYHQNHPRKIEQILALDRDVY